MVAFEFKAVENKLLLLYLIEMMEMPMSRAQITDFIIEKDFMNHFTLEQSLSDMVERGFLSTSEENAQDVTTTRYDLTGDGISHLELLEAQIPRPVRQVISKYVEENRGKIKKSFEKTASYFPNTKNGEFTVKCGVYDDKRDASEAIMLMEIFVAAATREMAKQIQANWNANYSAIYQRVLAVLTETGAPQ